MATLSEMRLRFERIPGCKLVSADVYIQGLTGHQPLTRSDEPSANLVGLLNEATGDRILAAVEDVARSRIRIPNLAN